MIDLNKILIASDGPDESLTDYGCSGPWGEVIFRDLKSRLIDHIQDANAVFGCVAWLTDLDILKALSTRDNVSIIVQKEDFLRPDINAESGWQVQLRAAYESLPRTSRHSFDGLLGQMSYCSNSGIDGVRCVGLAKPKGTYTYPRCHHKFVVFARKFSCVPVHKNGWVNEFPDRFEPYAVWTGSFNFTVNATRSFENAIVLTQPAIVSAFWNEFQQIASLSEPLDWAHEWVAPEWRIGS